jgi:subfamily B ATP-binding cassette protein MsbA
MQFIRYLLIYKKHIGNTLYVAIILTIITGLLEGFGVLLVVPLLQDLLQEDNTNKFTIYFREAMQYFGINYSILNIGVILSIVFLIKSLVYFSALSYNAHLRMELLRNLKRLFFLKIQNVEFSYFTKRPNGYFLNIANEQISKSIESFHHFCQVNNKLINSIVYTILAITISPKIGILIGFFGFILFIIFRLLSKYIRKKSVEISIENGNLNSLFIDLLGGYKYFKSINMFSPLKQGIFRHIESITKKEFRSNIAISFTQSSREPIALILILILLLLQFYYFKENLSSVLVSIIFFYRGMNYLLAVQSSWHNMMLSIGSIELVNEEFQNCDHNTDLTKHKNKVNDLKKLVFKNVSFSFADKDVLNNFNLLIEKNTTTVITGKSGAGKTTVFDLIVGLYKPTAGKIFIDNQDLQSLNLEKWRKEIGYITQESVLFNDTILYNIVLHKNDLSDNEKNNLNDIIIKLDLYNYISELEENINFVIGQNGNNLSGGQKQRLFVARELYKEKTILLLDEASSSLDSDTESSLESLITEISGFVTIILITHSKNLASKFSRRFILNDGCLQRI